MRRVEVMPDRTFIRWIGRHYPLLPWRGRLGFIQGGADEIPNGEIVMTREGIRVRVLSDRMYTNVYYWGDYEPFNMKLYRQLVKPGDSVIDVGANFGWFTTCFARWVGHEGVVHAFEPVPHIYALAEETVALNGVANRVQLNREALGTEEGTMAIYTFAGLPHGHASASDLGRDDATPVPCRVRRLDEYRHERGIDRIQFLKVDVEGFERDVFIGARELLSADEAPIVAFEVNQTCLQSRGLSGTDTLTPLRDAGYTDFFVFSVRDGVKRAPADIGEGEYLAAKPDRATELVELARTGRLFR
jgi:FkbM family methyltransferase